jgi:hypothetical protein
MFSNDLELTLVQPSHVMVHYGIYIFDLIHIISFTFDHFISQLVFMGLSNQLSQKFNLGSI